MGQGFAMQAIGEYKDCDCASSLKQRDYKDATDLIVGSFYPQMKAESQCFRDDNISNTLVNGTNPGFQNGVCYGLDRAAYNQGQNAKYDFSVEEEKIATQTAKGPGAVLPWTNSIVRRLTPMECERLQGYPDGWTDIGEWTDSKGKLHKDADSPRYKALGNSIALPFWEWMAEQMAKQLKADGADRPTMASLFDGIGGFPLVFSRVGIYPIWASEIEEFPIAVTKYHFPEDNSGENAQFGMSVEENIQPPITAKGAGGVCGTNGGSPACNQGGMAVVQGADMYNGSLTGDIAATLNAASGVSPTHSGPSVVQGFDAYNQAITGDVAMPLCNKAADSDHIPVVCIDDK